MVWEMVGVLVMCSDLLPTQSPCSQPESFTICYSFSLLLLLFSIWSLVLSLIRLLISGQKSRKKRRPWRIPASYVVRLSDNYYLFAKKSANMHSGHFFLWNPLFNFSDIHNLENLSRMWQNWVPVIRSPL